MAVRGKSTLYDSEGNTKLEWVKEDVTPDAAQFIQECKDALVGYKPAAKPAPLSRGMFEDTLAFYPISDLHFGMYCWGREVDKSWDLKIADEELNAAADRLLSMTLPSKQAVLLFGGDAMHSDTNDNETLRSRNKLQVDGRHGKVFDAVVRFAVRRIDAALRKHERVYVRVLKGNHDEHSAFALAMYLSAWYRNELRVEVSTDPSIYWWYPYGKTFLGATHGHMAKPKQMPAVMATRRAKDWGRTEHRYIHTFHLHRGAQLMLEDGGCTVETHAVPIPNDAWSYESGFTAAGRYMQSIMYDKAHGEIGRSRIPVGG